MFLKYITLVSGYCFLFLSLILFVKTVPNKKANIILGSFFFILSIYCGLVSFHYTSLIEQSYSQLYYYAPVDGIFILLMSPCVYFYIRSILNKPLKIRHWKMLVHLFPLLPYIIFNIYFSTWPFPERINWLIIDFEHGTFENNTLNVVLYTQISIYLIMCYYLIRNQLRESNIVSVGKVLIDISWVRIFLVMNIVFIAVSAPLCFYLANERANIIIGQIGMDIQFIYIFFKSAWQTDIFLSDQIAAPVSKETTLKIDNQMADNYLKSLLLFVEKNKPYMKEDCNIQAISEQLGISVHQLSNILNQRFQKSFPEFINGYRINEAKRIISSSSSDKMTLEAIGFECGFGSKSSFNKTFKKLTNLTPSEYRQSIKLK